MRYWWLSRHFSPDGNYFYFVRSDPGNAELKFLYRAPLLGGTPQKLASDVDSNITFSPDGKRFAFLRYDSPEQGKYQLIVRPAESGEEKVLASGPTSQNLFYPAWSPDGKTIVCDELQLENALEGLVAIDVKSGSQKIFFRSNERLFEAPAWLPDGSGLVGLAREQSSNFTRTQIAFVSYPKGEYSPVTHDTNSYSDLSVATAGNILATVQNEYRWRLEVMPTGAAAAEVRPITSAMADTNFAWTADNQLISDHAVSGNPSACGASGSTVFIRFEAGVQTVWRMDNGSNFKQLTNGKLDTNPVCSQDGKWVFFVEQGGEQKLAKVPIEGGPVQVILQTAISSNFDISPDGKLAAFATLQHSGEHKEKLALVETDGGKVTKTVDFERPRFGLLHFSRDGKAVVYPVRENGVDNLWLQPLDGSKGRQLTDFTSDHIFDFHWSFDGNQVALVRGHTDADVVLIRESHREIGD